MKIICITPDDLSTLIMCKTLSRILAERGGIQLFTVSPVDMYKMELRSVHSNHIEIKMDRFISPIRDILYLFRLYQIFKKQRPSVAITFATKPNVYGSIAGWLAHVPLMIMAVRGLGRTFNEPITIKDRLVQRVVKILYRLAAGAADLVWFTNINDQKILIDLGMVSPKKTFLTRNAVDLSDFSMENISPIRVQVLRTELDLASDDLVVIMVARLIWSKGIREFCEAAVILREQNPNLHFVLVAPEEPVSLNAVPTSYIREMEDRCKLKWLGFRKDVRELYALSDIAVLPSYYKEGGYPRALLEPMAYGKPVIAADTDDCRGPVEEGQNGFVVPPRNAVALASAIASIASDSERRREFGKHSLTRVRAMFDDRPVFEELIKKAISGVLISSSDEQKH
jgi:N,N'-diacetylbacillosaminyl-diphospho-undecaprenol alpha-1,3-N-acetylgalactosaminyltransferase